tara:strand:- start:633 stop:1940 length:1308 start_codon:yes stop_codon:yes gene_type:complete
MKKKNYKVILYLLAFIVIIFSVYFFIPKFFDYTPKLIQESLKKNSGITIKNISNVHYKFFPTPRLRLLEVDLEFENNILNVEDAIIDIVLNPLSIINYKILDYNKFLIKRGSTKIEIDKVNHLFNYIKKNQKKINFKENTIILLKENNKLFEINDSLIKVNTRDNVQQLNINGFFINHKISFILENKSESKSKIILKIPKLDISANIQLQNKDNFKTFEGLINFEVLNNFFQFNLIKEKNVIINKGFIRSTLINSSLEGELSFRPYFSFNLNIIPFNLNIERLAHIIQKRYFIEDPQELKIIKKIDGSLNFKNIFKGNIIFKNREILFKNFKIGKDNPIFFDAKIFEFGKRGKINFNLMTNIQNKKDSKKVLKISGFLIPSSSKVTFKQIIVDKEIFVAEKIKNYEEKFNSEVIGSLFSNIFNEKKINNFFKTFE